LYLRSLAQAFINYSPVYSFMDFLTVIFRTDYRAGTVGALKQVSVYGAGWLYAVKNMGIILINEIYPLVFCFVLAGLIGIRRNKKILGYFLISIATWILLAKMTLSGKNPSFHALSVITPYYLPLIPIVAITVALGIAKTYQKIRVYSPIIARTLVPAFLVLQLLFAAIAFQKASLSDYFIGYSWIKDMTKIIKPKSLYLAFGDNPGFLGFYGIGVERMKDDLVSLDAAAVVNNFRFTIAPPWKFSVWYPELELYKASNILPIEFFNLFAEKGKLYASSIGSVPKIIKEQYVVREYVLSALILSKDSAGSFKEGFIADFKKIDYLPVVMASKHDILATEIKKYYMFTTWRYAQHLTSENAKDADYYYRLSIFISAKPLKYDIIKDYVAFLARNQGIQASLNYLSELGNTVTDDATKREIANIAMSIKEKGGSSQIYIEEGLNGRKGDI
jgi:hypothetical protein